MFYTFACFYTKLVNVNEYFYGKTILAPLSSMFLTIFKKKSFKLFLIFWASRFWLDAWNLMEGTKSSGRITHLCLLFTGAGPDAGFLLHSARSHHWHSNFNPSTCHFDHRSPVLCKITNLPHPPPHPTPPLQTYRSIVVLVQCPVS